MDFVKLILTIFLSNIIISKCAFADFMTGLLLGFLINSGHNRNLNNNHKPDYHQQNFPMSALHSEMRSILARNTLLETRLGSSRSTTTTTTTTTTTSTTTAMTPTNLLSCGANATFTTCLNECGNTCADFAAPIECSSDCLREDCTCAEGFVRDTRTGYCVLPNDCSELPYCPNNQVYYPCGSCPATCENLNPICPNVCQLRGNCDCAQGFVRNNRGECVTNFTCFRNNEIRKVNGKLIVPINPYNTDIRTKFITI